MLWGGEFGRSPLSQGGDGCDHHIKAFLSCWLVGASKAASPTEPPTSWATPRWTIRSACMTSCHHAAFARHRPPGHDGKVSGARRSSDGSLGRSEFSCCLPSRQSHIKSRHSSTSHQVKALRMDRRTSVNSQRKRRMERNESKNTVCCLHYRCRYWRTGVQRHATSPEATR